MYLANSSIVSTHARRPNCHFHTGLVHPLVSYATDVFGLLHTFLLYYNTADVADAASAGSPVISTTCLSRRTHPITINRKRTTPVSPSVGSTRRTTEHVTDSREHLLSSSKFMKCCCLIITREINLVGGYAH